MPIQSRQRLPHRSVILVASAVAFSLLGDQALYAVLPVHFKALGLFPFQVGIILSANRWIRLITNHLVERITARVDTKWVMPLVLLVSALLCVIYPRGKSLCLLCHSFRPGGGCRSNCWMDASRIHFDTNPLLCPRWFFVCRGHAFFNTAIESLRHDKLDRIYRMSRIKSVF